MPIIVAQHDPAVAKKVAHELRPHFAHIEVVTNVMDLQDALVRHNPRIAVLDLELIQVDEVQKLARKFANLRIVCTHRSPDERKWIAALSAGAIEFCHPAETRFIMRASRRVAKHHAPICA